MRKEKRRKFSTQELIDRYFKEQANSTEHPEAPSSGQEAFDKEKVYRNIVHTIGRRKRPARVFAMKWQVAAAVSILLCLSVVAYQYSYQILNYVYPHRMLEKEAPLGEITVFTLSDGSKIWLNAGSKLAYPSVFDGNSREVILDGEAYFDVAHNAGAPFLVHTGKVTTRVLGTRFNISAYPKDENIIVSVDQGKVGVSASGADGLAGNAVLITPRQRAVYNKNTKALVRGESEALSDAASWKEGELIYRNMPLPEIIGDIQRTYNVQITTGTNVRNCIISADFDNDSLATVLQILAELVNGHITEREGKYILSGAGCRESL